MEWHWLKCHPYHAARLGDFWKILHKKIIHGLTSFLDLSLSLMYITLPRLAFTLSYWSRWLTWTSIGSKKASAWVISIARLRFTIWSGQCTNNHVFLSWLTLFLFFWVMLLWHAPFSLISPFFWVMLLWHAIFSLFLRDCQSVLLEYLF